MSDKDKILSFKGELCSWRHEFPVEATKAALAIGLEIVLVNINKIIISLKSRDGPVFLGLQTLMVSNNLQHLHLEMRVGMRIHSRPRNFISEVGSDSPARSWRQQLQALEQLKTLRLGVLPDAEYYTAYDGGCANVLYVDDLLVNPNNPKDHCYFPRLQRLELSDSACRLTGLLTFLEKHQQRLKQLSLNRIILPPGYSSSTWNEIAAMCREAMPDLAYLRLTKLVTRCPNRSNNNCNNGVGARPTSKDRRSCLEDAMTYERTKGGANGTDEEFIGFKCPWTYEDPPKGNGEVSR